MANLSALPLFNDSLFAGNQQTRAVTSSNQKFGTVFVAPKTGNIRSVGACFTAFSGSGTVDMRAETVSSRLPSGTLFGTNTNASLTPSSANTFVWQQMTADAAVTAGNLIAAVVGYVSGTSATGIWSVSSHMVATELPYPVLMSAGSWVVGTNPSTVGLKYDDGTIIRGIAPLNSCGNTSFQSGTNPNERATVFTPPFNCTLVGAKWWGTLGSNGTYSLNIYSGTGTSVMTNGSVTVPANGASDTNIGLHTPMFPASISLTAGTQYRISIISLAAVNVLIGKYTWPSATERNVAFGEMTSDTRNGSSWIGETTTQSEMIIPLIDTETVGGMSRSRAIHGT